MKDYRKELDKIGVVAGKVGKIVEERLVECVSLEYSSDFIALRFCNKDRCSYRKITVEYKENKKIETYVEEFITKYLEDDYVPYRASELEIFIAKLLLDNKCEYLHTDTRHICFHGNDFLLEDITGFHYFPTINSIRIDTNLEYALIDMGEDTMETFDYDMEVDDNE